MATSDENDSSGYPASPPLRPTADGPEDIAAPHIVFGAPGAPPPPLEDGWVALPLDGPTDRALTAEEKWPGEWHAIAWMVAHGSSQRAIARELDYTESRISIILSKPAVQEKIEAIRREFGAESLHKRFEATAPKAAEYFTRIIEGKELVKPETRLDASKWMLEKVTGKPKQEGTSDSGTTVLSILQALDNLKQTAPAAQTSEQREVLEIAGGAVMRTEGTEGDWMDNWVTEQTKEQGK